MDNSKLFLRFANTLDKDLLLKWANDKLSRENSFNNAEILAHTHEKWFNNILNSNDNRLFILMKGDIPLGQIRIHINDNSGIVSYSIANQFRGFGYGKTILKLLENWISINYDKGFTLIGLVKKTNQISIHIFESSNYEKIETDQNIEYLKKIYKD